MFSNKLTGAIPTSLSQVSVLQIIHVKDNMLTGTIPADFGNLSHLSWFDISQNQITGTIPMTFTASTALVDFRLASNMIYGTVPLAVCKNKALNGGATVQAGCDGVVCPIGTYSESGHAIVDKGCIPCPPGQTTMYLGSTQCETFSDQDFLHMLFEVFDGNNWPEEQQEHWKDLDSSFCQYAGVECDTHGELKSLNIPLATADLY